MIRALHRCLRSWAPWLFHCRVQDVASCRPKSKFAKLSIAWSTPAEAGDAVATTAPIIEQFDGYHGALDRCAPGSLERVLKLHDAHAGVAPGALDIEPRGRCWMVVARVALTRAGRVLSEHAGAYRIESAPREEVGTWRCYSAHCKPVLRSYLVSSASSVVAERVP